MFKKKYTFTHICKIAIKKRPSFEREESGVYGIIWRKEREG